ncbi:MAG: peptidylprolyl isomerase [Verrucomicrobiota bacterium]
MTIKTSLGDMKVELYEDKAPGTVKNFLEYADSGYYRGTIFHRVIKNFMSQGGGFNQQYKQKKTLAAIKNEADNGLKNEKYTLAMARTSSPNSATSQFFINAKHNTFLNHSGKNMRGWGYCVFGKVIEGQDVADKINAVATGPGGRFSKDAPKDMVVINEITRVK